MFKPVGAIKLICRSLSYVCAKRSTRTAALVIIKPGEGITNTESTPAKFPSGIAFGTSALPKREQPGRGVAVGKGVRVGVREGVAVGSTGVFVRVGVAVGGIGVFVRVGVAVGGTDVLVWVGVAVGGTGVFV